jgi:hypothetical protein
MSEQGGKGRAGSGREWLVLAGVGAGAAAYAAWAALKSRQRSPGAVGAHAWLVPVRQVRAEAKWTRQALGHASESKHG